MIQWRIYTERKNFEDIIRFTTLHFENATYHSGTGLYKLTLEDSLVIEIIGNASDKDHVLQLAQRIKEWNNQEAVLITSSKLSTYNILS